MTIVERVAGGSGDRRRYTRGTSGQAMFESEARRLGSAGDVLVTRKRSSYGRWTGRSRTLVVESFGSEAPVATEADEGSAASTRQDGRPADVPVITCDLGLGELGTRDTRSP